MKRWTMAIFASFLCLGAGWFLAGSGLHGQNPATPQRASTTHPTYRDVVKKVLPAVVSIETKSKVASNRGERRQLPIDPSIPEEFRRFFDDFRRQPLDPDESPRKGFGSGFIIDASGIIVTNFHVVDDADQAIVQLHDGRKFNTKTIRTDRRTDLAVLMLDTKESNFPILEFGDSDSMEIGDAVLAVGAPFGLAGSVTHGIVSAKGRNGLHMNMYEDFIQTDAAINPGNSGGPLVNLDGQVIGINAAIKSKSGGFQGVGLAVASNLAKNVIRTLRTDGVVRRGYLGVQIRDLEPAIIQRLNLPKDTGVMVGDVYDKTPASKAGLLAGDIVLAMNGKEIHSGKQLQNMVATLPLNQAVEMKIVRDGKEKMLPITIEEQPNEFGTTTAAPAPRPQRSNTDSIALDKFGIELSDLSAAQAESLGYRAGSQGALIAQVQPNSLAYDQGLRRNMLITRIDQTRITNAKQAQDALEQASLAKGVLFQIQSPQGGTNYLLLQESSSALR